MKSNVKIFVPVFLAIIIGSLTFVFAQTGGSNGKSRPGGERGSAGAPRGGGDGFRFAGLPPHILRQLNLTDAQETQIDTLETTARTASEPFLATIRTAEEQLRTLVTSGTFSEEQARVILNTKAQASIELELIRLRTGAAIYSLLTAEQRTLLAQLLEQRGNFPRGH